MELVRLCPYNDDQDGCGTIADDWVDNGWMLFLDIDNPKVYDETTDTIILSNTDSAGKDFSISFVPTLTPGINNQLYFDENGIQLAGGVVGLISITIADKGDNAGA